MLTGTGLKTWQQSRASLEQRDGGLWGNMFELTFDFALQFTHGPGEFDTSGAATDDDHVEAFNR